MRDFLQLDNATPGRALLLEEMMEALRPRIISMAAYYARRSGEEAGDLQQEAWLGVLEALPALDRRIGNPEQHLLRYARWRLLDALRRSRVQRFASSDGLSIFSAGQERTHIGAMENLTLVQDAPEPALTAEAAFTVVCMNEFYDRLPATQRAIVQCLLHGLTWRETGQALGCTSANVAYHVRRIRHAYELWCRHPTSSVGP